MKNIISLFKSDNPGVHQNLYRLLSHGALSHTGRMIIYSVDQGFELGPDRSFSQNQDSYDPFYHVKFACSARLSAIAAHVGFLESCIEHFIGRIPFILKLNSNDRFIHSNKYQAITSTIDDALRLGCSGVGFTIYPGSNDSHLMYKEIAELSKEAKAKGLFVVLWAYPKSDESEENERAIDNIAYATHIACLLGAHIIKTKLPTTKIAFSENENFYKNIKIDTIEDRVLHIMKSAFANKKLVLFSGGEKNNDEELYKEVSAIAKAGGNGSIIGRNFFQRPFSDALLMSEKIISIYKNEKTSIEKKQIRAIQ